MSTENDISEEERKHLEEALAEGESIVWAERPSPYHFNNEVWMFFIHGVIWTVLDIVLIALFATGVIGQGEDVLARLINCFYLFILLPLTLGACYSPIWNFRKMKRTVYALTEKRALVQGPDLLHGRFFLKEYPLRPDMIYERRIRHNGSGDIIFKEDEVLQRYGFGQKKKSRAGFVRLRKVAPVKELIYKLIETRQNTGK